MGDGPWMVGQRGGQVSFFFCHTNTRFRGVFFVVSRRSFVFHFEFCLIFVFASCHSYPEHRSFALVLRTFGTC